MSTGEVRRKLRLRAAEVGDVDVVMGSLKEYGMVDDAKFAEAYAMARKSSQGFGAQRVERDLFQKRVPKELVKQAVATVYAETDESALAEDYLLRKLRGKDAVEYLSEQKHVASMFRRLRTAGFSAGSALKALRKLSAAAREVDEGELGHLEEME